LTSILVGGTINAVINERILEMNKFIKIISMVLALAALTLCAVSCTGPTGKAKYDVNLTGEGIDVRMSMVNREVDKYKAEDFVASKQQSDFVLIKVENYGDIVVALRSDIAPVTVKNFKALVADKFYDGMVFHRAIENFMIQGRGYTYVGDKLTERDADTIKGEFTNNGVVNNLTHVRGVISMARVSNQNNSASSQFFIVHQTNESTRNLNKEYATFGYVLAGMDVVDAIAVCECEGSAQAPMPVEPVVIESITFVEPK
jgi:peptidyl-prolyl cis-trans isomerase B (cyclophilin B)